MSFGAVLKELKLGIRISRKAWKAAWIKLEPDLGIRMHAQDDAGPLVFQWGPSQADILADDWQIEELE